MLIVLFIFSKGDNMETKKRTRKKLTEFEVIERELNKMFGKKNVFNIRLYRDPTAILLKRTPTDVWARFNENGFYQIYRNNLKRFLMRNSRIRKILENHV